MMDSFQRDKLRTMLTEPLARMIKDAGGQMNTRNYMHLAYLLQCGHGLPLDYEYFFLDSGIYSVEATHDLALASQREEVEIEATDNAKAIGVTSINTPSPVPETQPPLRSYVPELQKIVRLFGQMENEQLSLRTSIIYIWKSDPPADYEDIEEMVSVLRTMSFNPSALQISAALAELHHNGYIRNIPKSKP